MTAAISLLPTVESRANAAQIAPSTFGSHTVVTDFDSGFPPYNHFINGPLVVNGNTYTGDRNSLRYDPGFGSTIGRNEGGLSNNYALGFIDVVLGTGAKRAGGYTGGTAPNAINPARVRVDFFDELDQLLGSVTEEAGFKQGFFAGWEAEQGLIKRVRFNALVETGSVLIIDDFMTEAATVTPPRSVPEPTSIVGLMVLGMALSWSCRQQQFI
ncbi:MAG: PEP-CTERM sorting domain-containing protein [Leptolyngbyaceae cyanobacterium bins.302]|nr:PEP-CTERM sorting domain-containing protein [Leptolyngbyaceae cyanobacterium bins.302]